MVKEKVIKTIKDNNLIDENMHIVIGLSGGPDSVCLFYVLLDLAKNWNLTLHTVHVNHKFRPGDAELDQAFVEKISQDAGVKCRTFVFDCNKMAKEQKISGEEAGRNARYQSFAEVCESLVSKGIKREKIRIAVAQNADDQSETILFRILRGVGTDGLSGIDYKRYDSYGNLIIRPLLDVTRGEIMEYCDENHLEPRIDKTNLQPIYTRNKIRINLIPYLEREYNLNLKDTINRMGKIAKTDKEFIWQEALKEYDLAVKSKTSTCIILNDQRLKTLHKALRQRIISKALEDVGLKEDISFNNLEICDNLIFTINPSAMVELPKGFIMRRVYDDVMIEKTTQCEKKSLFKIKVLPYGEYMRIKEDLKTHGAFDREALESAYGVEPEKKIVLRNRRGGDYIWISEISRKKIQDYFVDAKIPKHCREQVELISLGSDVLWVKPSNQKGRYSFKYKLCDTTKNVIIIEITN